MIEKGPQTPATTWLRSRAAALQVSEKFLRTGRGGGISEHRTGHPFNLSDQARRTIDQLRERRINNCRGRIMACRIHAIYDTAERMNCMAARLDNILQTIGNTPADRSGVSSAIGSARAFWSFSMFVPGAAVRRD
jgi:hypothetical protein